TSQCAVLSDRLRSNHVQSSKVVERGDAEMKPVSFGTGGWRESIADGFTRYNVRRIAPALANRMAGEGVTDRGVVVGYDRRFLSAEAAWWAVEVLAGNGVPVTLVERPVPTPMIMWTVRNKETPYGLCVTASHNPALYNG